MIERALEPIALSKEWGRQMRFIAGPRQSGKTTLAKTFLKRQGDENFYYNWDNRDVKLRYQKEELFLKEDLLARGPVRRKRWVCFDEIHKMPKWKNILKAIFDSLEKEAQFIVTGSARLDLFRRSGDSLSGRYFLFHLLPLNLFELTRTKNTALLAFEESAHTFVESRFTSSDKSDQSAFETLLAHGGFPEPFLKGTRNFLTLWHRNYLDRLIREDLRDLTRIGELENVARLIHLLPERIGSPLSVNSLREDLSVSHETATRYLQALRLTYFLFEVPAHSDRLNRTLTKEKKVYFHDWSFVTDEGKRFENYVAAELLSWIDAWDDAGTGTFDLRYIRTRDGKESDFLILRDKNPWLLIETKLSDGNIDSHHYSFQRRLGEIPIVQICREEAVAKMQTKNSFRISASRFFSA